MGSRVAAEWFATHIWYLLHDVWLIVPGQSHYTVRSRFFVVMGPWEYLSRFLKYPYGFAEVPSGGSLKYFYWSFEVPLDNL